MRYDEMHKLYPQIEELFAQVSDQIHAGQPATAVIQFLELRVGVEIQKRHRQAVVSKLARFAQLVEENSKADVTMIQETPQASEIVVCPCCGSLDVESGVCMWCHYKPAG